MKRFKEAIEELRELYEWFATPEGFKSFQEACIDDPAWAQKIYDLAVQINALLGEE